MYNGIPCLRCRSVEPADNPLWKQWRGIGMDLFIKRKDTIRMNPYLDLFWTFARIGGFTFGGGYAMLPILQREVVEKRKWASSEELTDYFAIGQCTPGIIAVNTATFIGNKTKGIPGGIVATMGVVFPSLVIITLIAAFLQNFNELPLVQNAFAGIRAAVFVLILQAVLKLRKGALVDNITLAIGVVVFLLSAVFSLSPILLVLAAALAGMLIKGKGKPVQKEEKRA
jgi:chromate transporter